MGELAPEVQSNAYMVNAPLVVSEVIDGEAIIMHHGSGHYFSSIGSGALIWSAVERGVSVARMAKHIGHVYDLDEQLALNAVNRFVAKLIEHDLLRPAAVGEGMGSEAPGAANGPFSEPILEVHTDLADMLLLDPVHDVDEAGWPAPRSHVS